MTNQDTEHSREHDTDRETSFHRRSTDTGVRGWFLRNLNWIAYLLLAAAIAFSISNVRNEGAQRRTEIVTATQKTIKDSCVRGNATRALLRDLVRSGQGQLKLYLKDGVITEAQYERAIASNNDAIKKLADVDCDKAIQAVVDQQEKS